MAVEVTTEQVEQAREAAGETSYAFVEARVEALNDTQRTRLQELAEAWARVRGKFVRVTKGVDVDYSRNRAEIRAQVRSLLGLPGSTSASSSSSTGGGTVSVCNEFSY
jgi:hypothetical protein